MPTGASVLDVGCGDGRVASLIQQKDPTVRAHGLDIHSSTSCQIEYMLFNGKTFPVGDSSVDVCMFVDVLHHTLNISSLLMEARRVSRRYVLIKDHVCEGALDRAVLSMMDWWGNRPLDNNLPYNFKGRDAWAKIFSACSFRTARWIEDVPVYSPLFSWAFGRNMHCIVLLEKE